MKKSKKITIMIAIVLSCNFAYAQYTGNYDSNDQINRLRINYKFSNYEHTDDDLDFYMKSIKYNFVPNMSYIISKDLTKKLSFLISANVANFIGEYSVEDHHHNVNEGSSFLFVSGLYPKIKYDFLNTYNDGAFFASLSTPILTEYYKEKSGYNNDFIKLYLTPAFGYDNITRFQSLLSPWKNFKKGFNLLTELELGMYNNDRNEPEDKMVKLNTIVQYSYLDRNINLMINPYYIYENNLNTSYSLFNSSKIGSLIAVDINKSLNLEFDIAYSSYSFQKGNIRYKKLELKPRVNIFTLKSIEISLKYDFQSADLIDWKYTENTFGIDLSWLYDFNY